MEYFEIIGIVFGLLFLTVLIIVQINRMRETKKMKAEREKCFSMMSRCSKLLRLWETNVYEREEEIEWQCRNCGYVHKGKNAPAACPACAHPQAYFEEKRITISQ